MKKIISAILTAVMIAAAVTGSGAFSASRFMGDVNGDGEVDNKDVVVLFRYVSGGGGAADISALDYNEDGSVDNKDVVSLFRFVSSGQDPIPLEYTGYISELNNGIYERGDDEAIYNGALAKFDQLRRAANAETDPDKRFVLFAQAEAELLDAAVVIPTTSSGGTYKISRIAPHTVPYASWGNDKYRLKGMVISDEFLTPAERSDLLTQWENARSGKGTYDPAAYLRSKGHTVKSEYASTDSSSLSTLDWLSTYRSSDSTILSNVVDGLVEYDNLGVMQPALAESWEVSADNLTYTFHIRKGVSWYTADGEKYADLTAYDFEAGFRHTLDARGGLEYLVEGVVAGVGNYLDRSGNWDSVGCKATDKYTLVITLERPTSYFFTMLTYSCFSPLCKQFYESKGGVFGEDELWDAMYSGSYEYGNEYDRYSQVYCGPYLIEKLEQYDEIVLRKNPNYYNAGQVTLNKISFVYYDFSVEQRYSETVSGKYSDITMSKGSAAYNLAVSDGNFEKYVYVTDTDSTTYYATLNINRGTFTLDNGNMASFKTEKEKADTATALNDKNFRQAIAFAFDKTAYNSVSRGEELAAASLRNTLTPPDFVYLSKDVKVDGHTFKAGTFYGDLVQYYLKKLGSPVKAADGQDGWYNADEAKAALARAKRDLGDKVSWPIKIDITYMDTSESNTNMAISLKKAIEDTLGTENVVVNLFGGDRNDYYGSWYYASYGSELNCDMTAGAGWGPDYGDPSTYLDSFAPYGEGSMTHTLGLFW